jgi:excisionase family DNA binding protein
MTKLNDYLKTAEAARILGVSQNTLRLWAEAGKVPVRRNPANGYRLFRQSDLAAFLRRVDAGAIPPKQPKRRSG